MVSPPPAFTATAPASRAAVPLPVPTLASSSSHESSQSSSSRNHFSWQPLQYPAHHSPSNYLAPIPSHLLPVSDLDSSDLDHLDSSDLDHDDDQEHGHEQDHERVPAHMQQDACETAAAGILSLEQVLGLNAAHSSSHHQDPHERDQTQDEQGPGGEQDGASDINNLWAPPPMRKAALKARNAKTFADGDSADDDLDRDLDGLDSYSDFDHNSGSDSDFESNNFKYGKGKGPTRRPCNTQPKPAHSRRARRSCAVSPGSSRPNSAPTRDFFSCHLAPTTLASRALSPLHPHVHPSLNPVNLAAAASPLPALARAVLGGLAPLTLNIAARFEANAERERAEAVGGMRLASYEEMILEALLTQEAVEEAGNGEADDEFDGLVPKDMYAYMTSRYPTAVPPNFRGSATQALKKAMRKGLLARHPVSSKYVVNPEYTGALALGRAKPNLRLTSSAGPSVSRSRSRPRPASGTKSRTKRQVPVVAVVDSSSTDAEDDQADCDLMDVDAADQALALEDDAMVIDPLSPPASPTPTNATFSTLSSPSPTLSRNPRIWTPPPPSPLPYSPDLHRLFTPDPSPSPSPLACRPPTPPPSSRPASRQVPAPLDLSRAIPTASDWARPRAVAPVPAHGLPTPPTDHDRFVSARLEPGRALASPLAGAAAAAGTGTARLSTPDAHTPHKPCFSPHMDPPAVGKPLDWIGADDAAISPMWLTSPRKHARAASPMVAAAAVEGAGTFKRPCGSPCMARPAGRRARVHGELPAFVVVGDPEPVPSRAAAGVKRNWIHDDTQVDTQHKRARTSPWLSPPAASPAVRAAARGPSVPFQPKSAAQDAAFTLELPPVVPMPCGIFPDLARPMTSPPASSSSSSSSAAFALTTAADNNQPIWLPLVPGPNGTWRIWTPTPTPTPAAEPAPAAPAMALKFEASFPTAASGAYAAAPAAAPQPYAHAHAHVEYEQVPEWARLRPVTCPAPAPVVPVADAHAHMWSQQPLDQVMPQHMSAAVCMSGGSVFDCLPLSLDAPGAEHGLGAVEDKGIGLDWLAASCAAGAGIGVFGQGGASTQGAGVAEAAAMFDALVDGLAGGAERSSSWLI